MAGMPRAETPGDGSVVLPIPDPKVALTAYYAGTQMQSPMGGVLEVLRVQALEDGSACLLLECSISSLRYQLPIKRATRTEKSKVKKTLEEGGDPTCPRHGERRRLVRAGARFVCTDCGVAFGRPL